MIESEPFASALDSASRQRVKHDDDATDTTDDCCCVKRGPLATDPLSGKATEIRVLSFKRPHMRAFHCSWISFFVSFFIWFAIVPLLPYIKDSLDLTERQIFISNLFNLIPTERLIVGPMCDRYGPRKVFLVLLSLASIPTACTGLVNSAAGLYIIRFLVWLVGALLFVNTGRQQCLLLILPVLLMGLSGAGAIWEVVLLSLWWGLVFCQPF